MKKNNNNNISYLILELCSQNKRMKT